MIDREPDWLVLLIGSHSGAGKTTAAKQLGLMIGAPWLMVDDLRLAFVRAQATLPAGTEDLYFFDKAPRVWEREPDALFQAFISLGKALSAPIEAVVENHVDTSARIVMEGEGILPSIYSRPSVAERAAAGAIRTVFLVEAVDAEVFKNLVARGRAVADRSHGELNSEARAKWLYGQWLAVEAARYNLPVIEPRPRDSLVERIVAEIA